MRTIVTMAAKDIRILLRDRLGFLFTAVFPLVIALLVGVMYSDPGPDRVAAALIDKDLTPGSERFVARLKAANEIELELIREDRALGRVRRGQIPVLIVLKPGFGAALDSPWTTTADVELTVDPSRIVEVFLVRAVLLKSVGEELSERPGEGVPDTGLPVTIDLVEVQAERYGLGNAFSISFAQGMVWALIGGAVSFSITIAVERGRGTLMRLLLAPVSAGDLLAAKGLACFTATVVVSTVLICLGIGVFGVRPSSYALLLLAVLCGSACFAGIMMALSMLGSTERAAAGSGWAIMAGFTLIGGGMAPRSLMPAWMQQLSNISPVKWALQAFEGAIWRGFSLSEMLLPCGVLVLMGAATFVFGARRLSRWGSEPL